MGHWCDEMEAEGPLVAVPSGVPFTRMRIHVRKSRVSSKLEVSGQVRAVGLDVNITYGVTFNADTENAFICLC